MAESNRRALEPSDFASDLPRMSDEQALRAVRDWRSKYGSYDAETAQLLEEKMKKAFRADGYEVPEMTTDERLRILRQRQFLAARRN